MKTQNLIPLSLAPMAGVGDRAFREVCKLCGADMVTTEMISAKAFSFSDKKTLLLADTGSEEAPISLQLFGHEPHLLAEAAAYFSKGNLFAAIDLNFGCPVPKIVRGGDGSALMKDSALCYEIAARVVESASVPVTAKLRAGWDEQSLNAPLIAEKLEKAGVARLAVHGRTRADLYAPGTVKKEIIREVVHAVHLPVIANGDIRDGESALAMLRETGCAGLMIGRGALGAPWIFAELRAALTGNQMPKIDRKAIIRTHLEKAFFYKPHAAGREMRMHMAHYCKGFRGAARERERASHCTAMVDYLSLLEDLQLEE